MKTSPVHGVTHYIELYFVHTLLILPLILSATSIMQGIFGASLTSQCIEHWVFVALLQVLVSKDGISM